MRERESKRKREREREREGTCAGEGQRERERIPSRFHADSSEPDVELDLTNHEIMT